MVAPGFFLRTVDLPAGRLSGSGRHCRVQSTAVSGAASIPTAIEQFDLQSSGALMWGYGDGWHEAEFNQTLGVWRWASDRSTLRIIGATKACVSP